MMGQDDVLDSGLSRTEVVRLITQSLYSLGYQRSAQLLEDESRIQLLSAEVAKFRRGVLEGRWDEAAGHIPALGLASAEAARAARFLLLEQQYLELVDEQAFEPALALLRDQLVPLSAFSERLPALASCLLCAQAGELRERCGWAALGAGASEVRAAARHRLLHGLQALLPPRALLPERRMEALLLQALEQTHPRAAAGGSAACHSLLQDQPPAEPPLAPACVAQLDGHAGEAWCVAFSACGHALASASRDGGLRIWAVPGGARAGGGAEAGAALEPAGGACAGDNATAEAAAEAAPAAAPAQPAGALAPVCYLQWSPDDSHVLACCTDGALKLWAAAGGCGVVRTYRRHAQGAQACAWLVGGRHFVSAGLDKLLLLWDVGGAVLQAFHGIRARDLALCAGGGRLLVLCADQRLRCAPANPQNPSPPRPLARARLRGPPRLTPWRARPPPLHLLWPVPRAQGVRRAGVRAGRAAAGQGVGARTHHDHARQRVRALARLEPAAREHGLRSARAVGARARGRAALRAALPLRGAGAATLRGARRVWRARGAAHRRRVRARAAAPARARRPRVGACVQQACRR